MHTKGTAIVDKNGTPLTLRSMGMGNIVYCKPGELKYLANHHNEAAYKELSDLGFNCVRFLLNYELFEEDEAPYEYKTDGFEWIEKNIEWAKKYNIGIVLNMHYPQGGYQSVGEGQELWYYKGIYDGNENQQRLCALWKEIASRFKDEPTIIGYGIVNEPTVLYVEPENKDENPVQIAIKHWDYLAKEITREIRKVDENHIIFVENCTVRDENLNWISTTGFETYPEIDDDNLVFEFHNYNPYYYTHQITDDNGNFYAPNYPDENYEEQNYVEWKGEKTIPLNTGNWDEGWNCASYTISTAEAKEKFPEAGMFNIKVNPSHLLNSDTGVSGKLFIDDVELYKIDADKTETLLLQCNFDEEQFWKLSSSPENSGKIVYNREEGNKNPGCLEYSQVLSQYNWITSAFTDRRFNLEEGCSYKITLWYKGENLPESTNYSSFGFDLIQGQIKHGLNRAFLYEDIKASADYFNSKGKPCFCGEFGCKRICFDGHHGGADWVLDTMSIFNELGLSYSYHAYHEQSFGLHNSDATIWGSLPGDEDLCVELAEVFKVKNK